MALRINMNTAALTAHRLLAETDGGLSKTIERLSSGFKINSAADDPAGLVISEKLRAQVGGLGQAIRNAGDAVNMVRTAEAALNEVSRLLRSMRDLALHAANSGANDTAAMSADQAQIDNAIASINKIAEETQFGQKKLLDGTAGIKANIVGDKVVTADFSKSGLTAATDVYISVTTPAQHGYATANQTYASAATAIGSTGDITINGVKVSYTTTTTVTELANAINGVSSQTGVTAAVDATNFDIELTSRGYGSVSGRISVTDSSSVLLSGASTSMSVLGTDAVAKVTSDAAGTINITDSTWSGDGLSLTDSLGNMVVLTQAAGIVAGSLGKQLSVDIGTMIFQVGAYAGQLRELNLSSVAASYLGTSAIAGQSLATMSVMTPEGAQDAIGILDAAIADVTSTRAELGAIQKNVFESSITSLTIAKENIAASESTIRDTDMAAEVVNLTRNQILQQAGVSMLAQANQTPQTLLKLLQ